MRTEIFLDTDVVLDFFTGRSPFAEEAARIFTMAEKNEIRACVSALSMANCYYVLKRVSTHSRIIEKLRQFSMIIEIIDTRADHFKQALESSLPDFEDAIQMETAQADPGIQAIITRNIKDFRKSTLPVLTPGEFLALLDTGESDQ
jgi:predicted nucleic acid-binding protein